MNYNEPNGLFYFPLAVRTGVLEDVSLSPQTISIIDSHPNPFNLSTTIGFTLPKYGFARLDIYSIVGQKVRTLLAENLPAGRHTVIWDGCDWSGIPVSTGVYLSRLVSGRQKTVQKMLLMK